MKKTNQSTHRSKKIVSLAVCSLFFSATALAQPATTYGSGAGTGGGFTNSYYGQNSGTLNTVGLDNTFLGHYSGRITISGFNTFVGAAAGFNNYTGDQNTFLGNLAGANTETGSSNTFLGRVCGFSNVSGSSNVYIGRSAGYYANGSGNTFVGTESAQATGTHTGSNNTLLGFQSSITDNPTNATAIGYGAVANTSNSIILGNSSVSVGIGVTAPVKKLTISSGATNDGIRITQTTFGYAGVELFNTTAGGKIWSLLSLGNGNTQGAGNFLVYNGTHFRSDLLIEGSTGNTVLGGTSAAGYKFYVNGAGFATGGWFSSDKRFKENISDMHDALPIIKQLQGVRYTFIDNIELPNSRDEHGKAITRNFPKGIQVGLIAQEVEKVLPEVVNTDNDGYKAIAYQNIVPLLIEGIKEQQKEIESIKDQQELIAQMNKKIEELQSALTSLQQCCSQSLNNSNIPGGTKPSLDQNVPNPLNNSTVIRYNIGTATNALIQFTNMEGRVMLTQKLVQGNTGQLEVNTENWPAGMYAYSLMVDGQVMDTKKMVIAH